MSLEHYTDQQLMDELLNRRVERERGEPAEYCHDCQRFKPWTKRGDPPDDYNPCSLGHALRFHLPEGWEDPHGGGFYRRICSDRKATPPPAPPKPEEPKEPPRGRPDWQPRTI